MNPLFCGRGEMSINQISAALIMHLQTLQEVLTALHSTKIVLHDAISCAQKNAIE